MAPAVYTGEMHKAPWLSRALTLSFPVKQKGRLRQKRPDTMRGYCPGVCCCRNTVIHDGPALNSLSLCCFSLPHMHRGEMGTNEPRKGFCFTYTTFHSIMTLISAAAVLHRVKYDKLNNFLIIIHIMQMLNKMKCFIYIQSKVEYVQQFEDISYLKYLKL